MYSDIETAVNIVIRSFIFIGENVADNCINTQGVENSLSVKP